MPKRKLIFYAFPSHPPSLVETIEETIKALEKIPSIKRSGASFRPWRDMKTTGKHLISTILQNIARSDVFACDLTYPNANVSFELGYAIGKFKRLWVSLDSGIVEAEHRYKRLYFNLLGLAYAPYRNHQELISKFELDSPLKDLDQTLLGEVYRSEFPRQENPTILYLKPPVITDAVIMTEELLGKSIFGKSIIVDDPIENPSPSLDRYAVNVRTADAVLIDLLSPMHDGAEDHNAKCSIIAGLAKGLGKPVMMSAHEPFESPVDYQEILSSHDTAEKCRINLNRWIEGLHVTLPRRRSRRLESPQRQKGSTLDLRRLAIGDPVAENERLKLDEYFVETSAYYRAMEDPTTIVVGRKGTGKTAILYAIHQSLFRDRKKQVCIIKPVGYEIDGLIQVLEAIIHRAERGYLIESLWKFLIYTELARTVYASLESLPPQQPPTEEESKFIEYFECRRDIIDQAFSDRLNRVVISLIGIGDIEESSEQRTRISEKLHAELLRDLRYHLGSILTRLEKVIILIDNLDKPWGPGSHLNYLSELIWGLLQVAEDIAPEFQHEDYWRKPVDASVTVFLRSDIFAFIQPLAAEQDKLPIQRIVWDEPALLMRLLNLRLEHSIPKNYSADDVWSTLFPREVVGM